VSKRAVSVKKERKQKCKRRPPERPRVALPPELERFRKISVREAAVIRGVSIDSFRRHFTHLIEQVSPRRQAVAVGKLLAEPESEAA
jgi:hypothetical protein